MGVLSYWTGPKYRIMTASDRAAMGRRRPARRRANRRESKL